MGAVVPPLAAVVLAAGFGTRLRPLTDLCPKALCPVNNVPLVDHAIARARSFTGDIAVNVHHHRARMEAHLAGRVRVSVEAARPLGTAGALGHLRDWIAGRPVLVLNSDAFHAAHLGELLDGDRKRARLLVVEDRIRAELDGRWRFAGACFLPWEAVRELEPEPSGLYDRVFAPWREAGLADLVPSAGPFFDCGTPAEYHAANMAASGGRNVVGAGAVVEGTIERCVVWPGAVVRKDEHLVEAIRAGSDVTVHARQAQQ